ncbi:hypothetical protein BCV72DRAFT_88119 [Rhizopus microsporus var. microsporus]|uniref:Uncharacterized protein n=1 Tax=Rhizopus microsporus var. microsporus TaxID=86635 RepID=A0A1X0QML9_RHIZD|nr:hypothetical protein BCV72DRAFT_88119 [Rhizopus microsporus var. microsporus]
MEESNASTYMRCYFLLFNIYIYINYGTYIIQITSKVNIVIIFSTKLYMKYYLIQKKV